MLVSELLDYVAQGFELKGKDIVEDHVLTRHRLQAFSTAYFGGGRLFSYSRENLKASQVIAPERKKPGDFIPRPLAGARAGMAAADHADPGGVPLPPGQIPGGEEAGAAAALRGGGDG